MIAQAGGELTSEVMFTNKFQLAGQAVDQLALVLGALDADETELLERTGRLLGTRLATASGVTGESTSPTARLAEFSATWSRQISSRSPTMRSFPPRTRSSSLPGAIATVRSRREPLDHGVERGDGRGRPPSWSPNPSQADGNSSMTLSRRRCDTGDRRHRRSSGHRSPV